MHHIFNTSMDETAATVTASMSTMMDAATPHYDQAKTTQDQGHQTTTTSMSAQSASCHHPDDASIRNPPQPSEDPGDAMGDNEHCPNTSTELPDLLEGIRR